MRSCSHCIKMSLCKYYERFDKELSEALRCQILAAGANDKTTATYASMSIYGGIARACTQFESMHHTIEDQKIKKKVEDFVISLQKDEEFLKEYFQAKSPEERIELVWNELEDILDSDDDDLNESIRAYAVELFGY